MEQTNDTDLNSAKDRRARNKKYLVFLLMALAVISVISAALIVHRIKNREVSSEIKGMDYYEASVPDTIYTSYSQRDTRWAGNPLGSSKDTMGSSGCLTSCIAASLAAQGVYGYSPGELNQIFNENMVYNGRGSIVWKEMEKALPNAKVQLDSSSSSESINRLLEEKKYPIVKVRRKNGAVHWVMLTGTEKDTYDMIALDPIDGYVHMSDYDNRIYGVRVVSGNETVTEPGPDGRESGTDLRTDTRTDARTDPRAAKPSVSPGDSETGQSEEDEGFFQAEEAFAQKKLPPVSCEQLRDRTDYPAVVFLSSVSQNQFSLYGYVSQKDHYNGIYITDRDGNMNSFPSIAFTSPQLILPKVTWNQEEGILQASFRTMTGASYSKDQFYAFLRYDTGHLEPYEFAEEEYKKQMAGRLSYKLDKEKNTVTFYDESEKIMTVSLKDMDGSLIKDVIYTDFVTFIPNRTAAMEFIPGFIMEGMTAPQYLKEDARMQAEVDVTRDSDPSGADTVIFRITDIAKL